MKFLLFLIPTFVYASPEIEDAKQSIKSLIQPLISESAKKPQALSKFRVDKCPKTKINWGNVLLMRETPTLTYKFTEGCDIQGEITPKFLQPFPANLMLRNIDSYSKVETKNKITADLQTKPILNLEMREGFLSGKHKVKFEVDYQLQVDPMEGQKAVTKNLGGVLRILEINGKETKISEKIMVK